MADKRRLNVTKGHSLRMSHVAKSPREMQPAEAFNEYMLASKHWEMGDPH
jgi:hypothetical protein